MSDDRSAVLFFENDTGHIGGNMRKSDIDYLNRVWTQHDISTAKTRLKRLERSVGDLNNQLQAIQDQQRHERELLNWLNDLQKETVALQRYKDRPKFGYREALLLKEALKAFPDYDLPDTQSRQLKNDLDRLVEEQRIEFAHVIGLDGQTKIRQSVEIEELLSALRTYHFTSEWERVLKSNFGLNPFWLLINFLIALAAAGLYFVPGNLLQINEFIDGNFVFEIFPMVFWSLTGAAIILLGMRIFARLPIKGRISKLAKNFRQSVPDKTAIAQMRAAKAANMKARQAFRNVSSAEEYGVSNDSRSSREADLKRLSKQQESLLEYFGAPE